jgi:uroporphyrinogen decarboxylase
MNKIERVRAALRGEVVDHVPASFWFHFPADRVAGQAMADAHLAYYRHASPDWLKVMSDNGYPLTEGVTLATPADWRKLRPPAPTAPQFQAQLDGLKRIVDAIGQEALIITTIFNVFSLGNNLTGKHLTEQMQKDPAAVSAGLGVIAEALAVFGRACLEAGASGIFFSAQGGEADRFSREAFEKYLKPHDLTVLRAVAKGAEFNLLHICGYNLRLDEYVDYPAHAVNWSPHWNNLSLLDGWKLFPGKALIGGMDQRGPLVTGPAEPIKAEVRTALATMGKKHVLLGAGCTLPNDVSWDNIRLAVEACHAL